MMKLALSAALVMSFCLEGQSAEGQARRTFSYERDVQTSFIWDNSPRWDGETLVGYLRNFSSGPVIYTMDREGKRDGTLFTLQDGARITIYNIAGSAQGEIAIAASALTADIRDRTVIARISPDRKRQVRTRTWPYRPVVVTLAPNGTIWTIGQSQVR